VQSRQRRQRGRRQQEHVASHRQHEEKAEPSHAEEAQCLHPFVHPAPAVPIAEPVDDRKDEHERMKETPHQLMLPEPA
jgi:hypothetical protein